MMDSSDGISVFLEQLASKKNSLRKAILMLALESKDLDEHLNSTKGSFSECVIDLESKYKILESNRDSVVESSRKLDAVQESLESRMIELEFKEEEYSSLRQTQLEELKMKEVQLAEIRTWVVEKLEEIVLKEEMLSRQTKSMELLLEKFQVEKQEFENIQVYASENLNAISLEKKKIENRCKELHMVQDRIEKQAKELDSKEENIEIREQQLKTVQISNEESYQKLDVITRELDCTRKMIEEKSEKLDSKEIQLNSFQQYIRKSFDDLHVRNNQLKIVEQLLEKQLEDQSKHFESLAKQLEEQFNNFELKKKQLEDRCKDMDFNEKRFDERLKYFELKQKQLVECCQGFESKGKHIEEQSKKIVVDSQVKIGQVKDLPAFDLLTELVNMDGRVLQLYLNEHFKDYASSSIEVCKILRLLSNSPKLVLDAMEGFYRPHLMKGGVEVETSAVRRSCILLLEQLMGLSPQIFPDEKKRALTLAEEWKVKIEVFPRNPLEVLAFILLLAAYKLAPDFDGNEVLQLLKFVPFLRQVPGLCRFLGVQEKVPYFIRRLVERRLLLEAVEYICVFNVSDEFPPGSLLDGYIISEQGAAGTILEEGLYSVEARDIACLKELNALKAVMSCVTVYELESEYPVGKIKARIGQLESRRILLQTLAPYNSTKAQIEERYTKKHKGLFP